MPPSKKSSVARSECLIPISILRTKLTSLSRLIGKPELVTLQIGVDHETFVVHKQLLCAKSEYFRGAFSRGFKEAKQNAMTLDEVDPRSFRTVINWVYTGRIEFEDGMTKVTNGNFLEAVEIYIWADRYETVALRRAVVDQIILCIQNTTPVEFSTEEIEFVFSSLPPNSGLCKLLTDLLAFGWRPVDEETVLKVIKDLPLEATARILHSHISNRVVIEDPNYWESRCSYHEHAEGECCNNSSHQSKKRKVEVRESEDGTAEA
jgi:hypothetical protein